jgi:hypothetical protein
VRSCLLAFTVLAACHAASKTQPGQPDAAGPTIDAPPALKSQVFDETSYLFGVPQGLDQMDMHCGQAPDDRISKAFCTTPYPDLHSLADLEKLLGIDPTDGVTKFAMTGNSSSLVATGVSPVNPRVVMFKPITATADVKGGFLIFTFTRGEPFVELATFDIDPATNTGDLSFYLVVLDLPCRHDAANPCTYADFVTSDIEKNWASATLYEDNELTGTAVDCLQCHKTAGGGIDAPRFLRMQEKTAPFTHWFSSTTTGGQALLADFHAAHGTTEDYGPIPAAQIDRSDPAALAALLKQFNFSAQPHPFDSTKIEAEVVASAPMQPAVNVPPGTSATWTALYNLNAAGSIIPPPYHDVKFTDPDKLAAWTTAYKGVLAGTTPRDGMPDPRDLALAQARIDMNFALPDGVDGTRVLVQACQQCHNPEQDQSLARADFDVTKITSGMGAGAASKGIARMSLPVDDPQHMPPQRFRTLTQAQIDAATQVLSSL